MITITVSGPPKSGKTTLIEIIQANIKVPKRIKYRIVERRTKPRAKSTNNPYFDTIPGRHLT